MNIAESPTLLTASGTSSQRGDEAIRVDGVSRTFGSLWALRGVSLRVNAGDIHALLGPNGAGKTTLLRILSGLVEASEGEVNILGVRSRNLMSREARKMFGLVPSGDRTFYLRLSGLENLAFFARLYGMRRREAVSRAWECLEAVDLTGAGKREVGQYSHGMQKRLSVARALLMRPRILLVDEATHDLDLEGARRIQDLVSDAAGNGAAVIWATQRLDEIRSFADRVTVLDRGRIAFTGSVPQLMATSVARRWLLHLVPHNDPEDVLNRARAALGASGILSLNGQTDRDHYLLSLRQDANLGDALAALLVSGVKILGCREERSEIEEAFLYLTGGRGR